MTETELKILNNLVSGYFDFAEIQAMKHKPMYIERQLDIILASTGENILQSAGSVSHEQAVEIVFFEYRKFQVKTLSPVEQSYLETIKNVQKKVGKQKRNGENEFFLHLSQ